MFTCKEEAEEDEIYTVTFAGPQRWDVMPLSLFLKTRAAPCRVCCHWILPRSSSLLPAFPTHPPTSHRHAPHPSTDCSWCLVLYDTDTGCFVNYRLLQGENRKPPSLPPNLPLFNTQCLVPDTTPLAPSLPIAAPPPHRPCKPCPL